MIFLLDNFDSFTFNIAHALQGLQQKLLVRRPQNITDADFSQVSHIVLSPGPGKPADHPWNKKIIENFLGKIPILGVCLGMQALNEALGGTTVKSKIPVHGKTSLVYCEANAKLFEGLPSSFSVARYHSLQVGKLSNDLHVSAKLDDETIMAFEHKSLPVFGVQFHPESFMSEYGNEIFQRFLSL